MAGCAGTTPEPPVASDRARLEVMLKAEPKKGWRDPKTDSAYAGLAQIGQAKQFETIDYESLDEIVVWVEPAMPMPSEVTNITIDPAGASGAVRVVPAGAVWFVKAAGAYLRTEDGHVMNLGSSNRPAVRGYVEVLVDPKPEPIARIFVTPTRFAQVGQSNTKLTFDDLPLGPARVSSWHPRLPGMAAEVQLDAGKTTSTMLTVGVNALPKVP